MKYVLVTGIEKVVVASSIGALLKACDLNVTAIKIDPYYNIDASNLSASEHGEVFVLNDGSEVDLDLGYYERFLDTDLGNQNHLTFGKILQQVNARELKGDYLGKTVETIPHITDAIQEWIENAAKDQEADICIIDLGVGSGILPFIEALRRLRSRVKSDNFCCIHVTPESCANNEYKLTQANIDSILDQKIHPDMIVCHSTTPMSQAVKEAISRISHVEPSCVFNLLAMEIIYQVPIELQKQHFIKSISSCLKLHACICDRLEKWKGLASIAVNVEEEIIIAVVGQYADLNHPYESVTRALEHACFDIEARPKIRFIDASSLEDDDASAWELVKTSDCMIVAGDFGSEIRGVDGKIQAIKYARENKMPFLGICLGYQLAVIELARNNLYFSNPHSEEFIDELKLKGSNIMPVVIEMLEYKDPKNKKYGKMRLGLRKTRLAKDSLVWTTYGDKPVIEERHRNCYEINPDYANYLSSKFVGKSEDGNRMDILEMGQEEHPYFVGAQFYPEYLSRPFKPSPLYKGLVEATRTNGSD